MKKWLRERWARAALFALISLYVLYFSALSIQRHNTFRTHASDLGQMDQALWNTLHGNWLQDTRPDGHQAPRLTDHVEPIFFVLPLSFLAYDGVESVLVLQSVAIALGALPLFWIARRRLESDLAALAFAAMYLLFPALEAANLAEFHAVTFAPAPLLLAYHYAEQGAYKRFALFSLIALAVKEEIALLVFAMAVVEWARVAGFRLPSVGRWGRGPTRAPAQETTPAGRSRAWIPAAIALVALGWFALAVFVIVPLNSPAGRSVYIGRYPEVSRDPFALIASIPRWVASVLIPDKLRYVVTLLASAGFIALFDPLTLLIGAPSYGLNLLSNYSAQYSGTYHYSAPVAPYFVLAAIGGAAALSRWFQRRWSLARAPALALAVAPAFLVALVYHGIAGYTPIGGEFFWPESTPHQRLLSRFTSQIPRDALVSTTSSLFPHLSHRRVLYRFPLIADADYVLLDVSQSTTTNSLDYRLSYLDTLKQGFGVRDAADGYILLQRGAAQQDLPDAFYDFLRAAAGISPQQRVTIDFDDKIRFLGFDVRQDDWQRAYLRTYWTRLPGMDANHYALFPFFPDENGAPRAEVRTPDLLVQFWYPTARWKEGEVIVADTLPMEMGTRAKIGVGVFFGTTWEEAERHLPIRSSAPVSPDGAWALAGEMVREGKLYRAAAGIP